MASLWVGLPILGFLPGVPIRLGTQWLSLIVCLVVLGVGVLRPRSHAPLFGWGILACLGLAAVHWAQPMPTVRWAVQATLLLASASLLVGQAAWMRKALIGCAWVQVVVVSLQWCHVPLPFPQPVMGSHLAGTVGSIRPASILIGLAALWSTGWSSWVLSGVACLTGSGTVVPVIVLAKWWPYRTRPIGWIVGLVGIVAYARLSQRWLFALSERAEVWTAWPLSWWGLGFRAFPGGFQDDTAFGREMGWRDAHNVLLDWVGRFGLPGFLVLVALIWWIWRRKQEPWTLVFLGWVACWQSLEQFPVLVIPLLVWLIGLCEGQNTV